MRRRPREPFAGGQLLGLDHWRPLATAGLAAIVGTALMLALSPPAAAACGNEAIREQQGSTFLPDCRAYELVSPADKGGGLVFGGPEPGESATAQSSVDGNALQYQGSTAFPGTGSPSAGLTVPYIGSRTASGWTSRGIALPIAPAVSGFSVIGNAALSPALTRAVVTSNEDLATGVKSPRPFGNFYWRDFSTGATGLITRDPLSGSPEYFMTINGVTPDLGKVFFQTQAVLAPGAPISGEKLYVFDGPSDTVSLASRLPNGNPVAGRLGAQIPTVQAFQHMVSDDGSVVYFTAASGTAAVYRRAEGRSVAVNASENTNEVVGLGVAQFRGASADGNRAFFTSAQRLVDADTNAVGDLYLWERKQEDETQAIVVSATGGTFTLSFGGLATPPIAFNASAATVESALAGLATIGEGNISISGGPGDETGSAPYQATFTGALGGIDATQITANAAELTGAVTGVVVTTTNQVDNLTLVSADQEPADGDGCDIGTISNDEGRGGVMGLSEDGHRVYFICPRQLVAGAQTGTVPPLKLYLWDDGNGSPELRYITAIAREPNPGISAWAFSAPYGFMKRKVTPDGRSLLFTSSTQGMTPDDNGGFSQVYLFSQDPAPGQAPLTCVSCPSGAPATAPSQLQEYPAKWGPTLGSRRNLAPDGRRAFFETDQGLLPGDVNGLRDVYSWAPSTGLQRLSRGSYASSFADASPSGNDVFVFTAERMVGADKDGAIDVYDVRAGGGFPEPPPTSPCAGEACQGSQVGPPAPPVTGSSEFSGPGNPKPKPHRKRRKCRRAKAGSKAKHRCGKGHGKHRKHKASRRGHRRSGAVGSTGAGR